MYQNQNCSDLSLRCVNKRKTVMMFNCAVKTLESLPTQWSINFFNIGIILKLFTYYYPEKEIYNYSEYGLVIRLLKSSYVRETRVAALTLVATGLSE